MSFKVGLALGGGAARGLSHFGVIKALEKMGIPIDIVAGSSIGGIIGAIYAQNPQIYECIEKVDHYFNSEAFDQARLNLMHESDAESQNYFHGLKKKFQKGMFYAVSMRNQSFISKDTFHGNLEALIPPDLNIEDCAVELGLVSMDLVTSEEIVFSSGPLLERVMASSAIPGFFPPITSDNRILVDGSWVSPIPVKTARQLGADFVIAVDITPTMPNDISIENGLAVSIRSGEGSRQALKRWNLESADIVISIDLMNVHWADFSKIHRCILEGEKITHAMTDQIKKAIFWKKMKKKLSLSRKKISDIT
ncbi:MAG: NTE family protein [bacterium]